MPAMEDPPQNARLLQHAFGRKVGFLDEWDGAVSLRQDTKFVAGPISDQAFLERPKLQRLFGDDLFKFSEPYDADA